MTPRDLRKLARHDDPTVRALASHALELRQLVQLAYEEGRGEPRQEWGDSEAARELGG